MNVSPWTHALVSQALKADLHLGKIAFCQLIMKSSHNRVNAEYYFVNLDRNPVHLNYATHRTIHKEGDNLYPSESGVHLRYSFRWQLQWEWMKRNYLYLLYSWDCVSEVSAEFYQALYLIELFVLSRMEVVRTLE